MTKQWLEETRKYMPGEIEWCVQNVELAYKTFINDRTPANFDAYQAACDYQTSVLAVSADVAWWPPHPANEFELAVAASAGP